VQAEPSPGIVFDGPPRDLRVTARVGHLDERRFLLTAVSGAAQSVAPKIERSAGWRRVGVARSDCGWWDERSEVVELVEGLASELEGS
jgi:hypothetical protein